MNYLSVVLKHQALLDIKRYSLLSLCIAKFTLRGTSTHSPMTRPKRGLIANDQWLLRIPAFRVSTVVIVDALK